MFGGTVASVVPELVLTRGVRVLTGIGVAFVHRVDFAINSSRADGTVANVTFRVRYSTYSSVLARVGIAIVSAKFAIFPVITLLAGALVARMHCGAYAAVLAGRGRTKIDLEEILLVINEERTFSPKQTFLSQCLPINPALQLQ